VIAPELEPFAVDVDSLTELQGNPRRGDVEAVKRSYAAFMQQKPIKVQRRGSELVVIDGNHQLRAARELGWDKIAATPFVMDDGNGGTREATVAEANAYALAANHTSDLGTYDEAELLAMMQSVYLNDVSMFEATSYSESDLLGAGDPPLTDPDDVPETAPAITKLGDLWLLGKHRVLCGDATDRAAYDRVLTTEHLTGAVIADPPYGVAIGAKNRALDAIDRAGQVLTDMDGDQGIEDVEKLWRASFDVLFDVLAPGSPYYIFGPQGGDLGLLLLLLLLRDSGLAPKHILIWAKNRASFSIGRLDYDYQHEPVVYGWRPGAGHPWYATEPQTSLLPFDRPAASRLHATMKPVDLLAYLIRNSAPIGGSVLDPFGGSGSTLIACEQTGRVAYLMEIDPHYVDVICKRFQDFTGTKPVLESTGEPHDFT
jgi:site-specific DNA-methyltransferase (adenine-specific)